jgi:anti-sigma-K factor RskA
LSGHPQFEEDLDLYALGALEREEAQELESHLETCPECKQKVEEARGRAALLALAAPPQDPPRHVRERLLKQIAGRRPEQRPARLAAFWQWATPALAALSLVLAVWAMALRTRNKELYRQVRELEGTQQTMNAELTRARAVLELLTAPDTTKVTLVAGEAHPAPQGKVFYHPQKGLLFYAANLPALPSGKTYQLWLVPTHGNPISAGIFQTDAHGNGEVLLPQLPAEVAAKAFAVTVEPAGGVPQPTGPKVLVGLTA